MKLKELYNKYTKWIVIILLVLLSFKSCQSCNRNRAANYQKAQYEMIVDSLENTLSLKCDTIKCLRDSMNMYGFQLGVIKDNNKALKEANKYYMNTNKKLVDANKNLSNKTEE